MIGQVTKSGQMAGANVLKHMVDALITLDVERKDEDLMGCRILQVERIDSAAQDTSSFYHFELRVLRKSVELVYLRRVI